MKCLFKRFPEGKTPPPPEPLLEGRPKASFLPPPPTNDDRLRDALGILNKLECEYEINYEGMMFARKKLK